jgi:predicted DCC family thiol-disulfide oxidoreductase YuxK
MGNRHLVLWDRDCEFCRRIVSWVGRRDASGQFETITFQDAKSPPMTPELFEACKRAVHVITREGDTLRAGRACLFILGELGWGASARILALPPLVWLVEIAYRIVAQNRYFFSRFLFRNP